VLRLGGLSAASTGAAAWLASRSRRPEEARALIIDRSLGVPPDPRLPELAIVQGGEPERLVQAALDVLGGATRFISRGDVVAIKPNVGWDRGPEQAANTNPELVAALIRLCQDAGAKKVVVADVSCNDPRSCFNRSGIGEAALRAGAELVLPEPRRFKEVNLRGDSLGEWPVLEPFLDANKLINVPIAKHHSLTGVTLGMKNWYGILGGPRNRLHQRIHESIVDLRRSRPTLTVMDAYRVLVRNGPTGGDVDDVEMKRTVVASVDPVAVDAYAAQAWWNLAAPRVRYLRLAEERGLGKMDFASLRTALSAL
jgi:uncharacterized protein (DUF362 family)